MPSNQSQNIITATDLSGRGLRVRFDRRDDRFGHTIEQVDGERFVPLLDSREGSADDEWPISPPLQSLSIEDRAETRVALLVGMAGRSHWSASIESCPATRSIIFDLACRVSGPWQRLGNCYSTLTAPVRCVDEHRAIVGSSTELVIHQLDNGPQQTLRCTDSGLVVGVTWVNVAPKTLTMRWTYRLTYGPIVS